MQISGSVKVHRTEAMCAHFGSVCSRAPTARWSSVVNRLVAPEPEYFPPSLLGERVLTPSKRKACKQRGVPSLSAKTWRTPGRLE